MSDSAEPPAAPVLTDAEAVAVTLAASHTFPIYAQTALILALAERQAVDVERVFVFGRLSAAILRQTAATTTGGKVASGAASMAADMLDQLEATIRNMVTKPPGAGTA